MHIDIATTTIDELEPWLDVARQEGAHIDTTLKSPWTLLKASSGLGVIFGWVGLLHRTTRYATIRGWYVKAGYRNLGIGTRLLEAAIDHALTVNVEQVDIRTNRTHILERLGFDWTGYQRIGGNQEEHWVLPLPERAWADRQTQLL